MNRVYPRLSREGFPVVGGCWLLLFWACFCFFFWKKKMKKKSKDVNNFSYLS